MAWEHMVLEDCLQGVVYPWRSWKAKHKRASSASTNACTMQAAKTWAQPGVQGARRVPAGLDTPLAIMFCVLEHHLVGMQGVSEVCMQGVADLWQFARPSKPCFFGAQGSGGLPAGRGRPVAGVHRGEPEVAAQRGERAGGAHAHEICAAAGAAARPAHCRQRRPHCAACRKAWRRRFTRWRGAGWQGPGGWRRGLRRCGSRAASDWAARRGLPP